MVCVGSSALLCGKQLRTVVLFEQCLGRRPTHLNLGPFGRVSSNSSLERSSAQSETCGVWSRPIYPDSAREPWPPVPRPCLSSASSPVCCAANQAAACPSRMGTYHGSSISPLMIFTTRDASSKSEVAIAKVTLTRLSRGRSNSIDKFRGVNSTRRK